MATRGVHLNSRWIVWLDGRQQVASPSVAGSQSIGSFGTIVDFWKFWNNLHHLWQQFPTDVNFSVLRERASLSLNNRLIINFEDAKRARTCFSQLGIALVGEQLTNFSCHGLMFSKRAKQHEYFISCFFQKDPNTSPQSIREQVLGAVALSEEEANNIRIEHTTDQSVVFAPTARADARLQYTRKVLMQAAKQEEAQQLPSSFFRINWDAVSSNAQHHPRAHSWDDVDHASSAPGMDRASEPLHKTLHAPAGASGSRSHSNSSGAPSGSGRACGFTLEDVKGHLLVKYVEDYGIKMTTVLTQQQMSVLNTEGCPICLRQHLLSVDEVDSDPDEDDEDEAKDPAAEDARTLVILTCKHMKCNHVVHLPCLTSMASFIATLTPAPVLEHRHANQVLRTIAFHDASGARAKLPTDVKPGNKQYCAVEVNMRHVVSNAEIMKFDWPHTIGSMVDERGNEYLAMVMNGAEAHMLPNLAFHQHRARLIFKCTNRATLESWEHDCIVDLSNVFALLGRKSRKPTPGQRMAAGSYRLVLVDPASNNVLTIGVLVTQSLSDTQSPISFEIAFIKYEFANASLTSLRPSVQAIQPRLKPMTNFQGHEASQAAGNAPRKSPAHRGGADTDRNSASPYSQAMQQGPPGLPPQAVTSDPAQTSKFKSPMPINTPYHKPYFSPYSSPVSSPNNTKQQTPTNDDSHSHEAKVGRSAPGNDLVFQQMPTREPNLVSGSMDGQSLFDAANEDRFGSASLSLNIGTDLSKPFMNDSGSSDFPKFAPFGSGRNSAFDQTYNPVIQPPVPNIPEFPRSDNSNNNNSNNTSSQYPGYPSNTIFPTGPLRSPNSSTDYRPGSQGSQGFTKQGSSSYKVNPQVYPFESTSNSYKKRGDSRRRSRDSYNYDQDRRSSSVDDKRGSFSERRVVGLPQGLSSSGYQAGSRSGSGRSMKDASVIPASLTQAQGSIVKLCRTHDGSRFVQDKLNACSGDSNDFHLCYAEMRPCIASLMMDSFGHFAAEKLITKCNDAQLVGLLEQLTPDLGTVACQKHGSFSVQAMMDVLHTPEQIECLMNALNPHIVSIILHSSGHFVVLRFLQRFAWPYPKFIFDAIEQNCLEVVTDHHGLRVVKAVLATRKIKELSPLFKEITRLTTKLVENQYGNYVIQAVLDVAPKAVRTNIKVKMEGKYLRLAKQKFSSNVVERNLKNSSAAWRSVIIKELSAQPAVGEVLRDRYGNYCLQTALQVANTQEVQMLVQAIVPHLSSLRDNVRLKWESILRQAQERVGITNQFPLH